MGLLSDPEYGSVKWVKILRKVHGPVCFTCYVGALIWFMLLGHRDFNNETYFSENALLPGLVTNEFNENEQTAKQFYNEFLLELEDKYSDVDDMPIPWLVGKMSQLHLEVYTHNFTLNYPLGQGQVYHGTNVYGILRAARTPSLEALVVSAPYRPLRSHQKGTAAGIALMLAFAQFARPQKYWAKDIIFLITEHEQLGMQAWLEAYHGLQSNKETFYTSLGSFWKPGRSMKKIEKILTRYGWSSAYEKSLNPGKLSGRSGSIQAAINLEIHDPKIKYIEVKVEGLNGQLPNLDLVNLVHKLCVKSGVHHSYKSSYSWVRIRNKMDEWRNNLWTMLGMVSAQLAGVPNGNHGLFHRFGIEAVTLEGRDANDPAGVPPKVNSLSPANFYRLGTALESILRSLNNLLERFHQSYFFYLLAGTNRFISIGQYMPSLCLLCVAMLIKALSLWVSIQQNGEEDDKQTNMKTEKKRKTSDTEIPGKHENEDVAYEKHEGSNLRRRKKSESKVPGDDDFKEESPKKKASKEALKKKEKVHAEHYKCEEPSMSIVNIGANYLLVHLIGYGVMKSPYLLTQLGTTYFDQPSEVSVYYGLIVISVFITILAPFLPRLLRTGPLTHEELSLVNILALIELATMCLTVGMHNFPLGLVVATLYTPVALVASVASRGDRGEGSILTLKRAWCLMMQPLCILTLTLMIYGRWLYPEDPMLSGLGRGADAAMQSVMFAIVDNMIYGNWLYNVATSILFPTWIIFWQILCNRIKP